MSDLELETQNTAETLTELIATPHDLGPDHLKDFVGNNILEVKPGTTLLASQHSNFGGIYGRGVGTGVGVMGEAANNAGVHGRSAHGVGVWGRGAPDREGVFGDSQNSAGVRGVSTNSSGVVGEGAGSGNAGVLGRNATGHGVRGEGETGVVGISSTPGFGGVSGIHNGEGFGVVGDGSGADVAGVLGRNGLGDGVRGEGVPGVHGVASIPNSMGVLGVHNGDGFGVVGDGSGAKFAGVFGRNNSGNGVIGDGAGAGFAGVLGSNSTGHGVRGEGETGVLGISSTAGRGGISGIHQGQGFGVIGDATSFDTAGVLGRNEIGDGLRGEGIHGVVGMGSAMGAGSAGSHFGAGVYGVGPSASGVHGTGGYGGQFEGTRAQLRLVPGSAAGRPSTGFHAMGELYMDSNAALWVCVADGEPGTWVGVMTAA